MAIWQGSSLRRPSGARSRRNKNKRNAEFGRSAANTRIGDEVKKEIVARGNCTKTRATVANRINVIDPKDNLMFNRDAISRIYYIGYLSNEETSYNQTLDKLLQEATA